MGESVLRAPRDGLYTLTMHAPSSHDGLVASLMVTALTASVMAQNGDRAGETQPNIPLEWQVKDAPIRSAAEEAKTFDIVDGYAIQLVAAEPLVEAPIAFEFGPDGRMWVVEMRGYMRDANGGGELEPIGRIKVLTDSNGDGQMDKAQVFLDGLVMPRALAPWRDGVLIVEPPYLLFCRDTNGDGVSDESRVVASGFAGKENPEHAGNGLIFSLDNTFTCSQHPFRFALDGDALRPERVPPHGQWGVAEDAQGRLYYSPNSDPLLVDLVPKTYAARNPAQMSFEGSPSRAPSDMRVYPSHLTPGINRGYQSGVLKDGKLANFTGACSPYIQEGAAMGSDMQGCALVCEVAGNLVHRYRLTEDDGAVVATPADGARSFWTSTDERFRPVFCRGGPDGAIYVADMYRGIIQHRDFMTTFLRTQVDARGLAAPLDAGRIWRIVPTSSAPAGSSTGALCTTQDLSKLDVAALAQQLAHAEKPVRTTARRLFIERYDNERDQGVIDAMRAKLRSDIAVTTTANVHLILEPLWTLSACDAVDNALLIALFASDSPIIRTHALRVAEKTLASHKLITLLERALLDTNPQVRLQAVLSAGVLDAPLRLGVLEHALANDVDSKIMRSALISSLSGAEEDMLASIVQGHALTTDSISARAFATEFFDTLLDDDSGRPQSSMLTNMLMTAAAVAQDRPWLAETLLHRIAAKQRLNAKEPIQLVASMEPVGWINMLQQHGNALTLATPIDRNVFWPGREAVSFVAPKIARSAQMSVAEFGKRLFSNCMSCHQANGRGLPPVYPPLRGSDIVHGDPTTLVCILLYGLEGRIEVAGQIYSQVMPAASVKSDDEIAAVLTYVRSAWGNSAEPIDPAFVAKVREETKGRQRSFTAKELGIEATR